MMIGSFPVTIKQHITITAKVVHCQHLCKVEFTVVKYIVEVFTGPLGSQYPKPDLGPYIILSLNLPVGLILSFGLDHIILWSFSHWVYFVFQFGSKLLK